MPAEAREVLRATSERLVEMKSFDAAPRALRDSVFFAEDERRPMKPVDEAACDNPRHSDVPSWRGDDQRATLAQVLRPRDCLVGDARLQLLPLGIGAVELLRQRPRFRGILGEQ